MLPASVFLDQLGITPKSRILLATKLALLLPLPQSTLLWVGKFLLINYKGFLACLAGAAWEDYRAWLSDKPICI